MTLTMSGTGKQNTPNLPADAASVTDKTGGTGSKKPVKRPSKVLVAVIVAALLLVVVGVIVLITGFTSSDNNSKSTGTGQKEPSQITEYNDAQSVVERYESEKQSAAKAVQKTAAKEWDKELLDKAYFSLIYADKTGSFTEVYAFLSLLDAAKKSGVNIDDNKYGIDQAQRDEMLERANAAAKQAKRKQQVAN